MAAGIEEDPGVWVAATQHRGVQSAADIGAQRTHRSVGVPCEKRPVKLPEVLCQSLSWQLVFIRKWFQKAAVFPLPGARIDPVCHASYCDWSGNVGVLMWAAVH